jgi:putative tricarboxylic transport membrane protein
MNRKWYILGVSGMTLALTLVASGIGEAAFPERPIELTVPFAAGGGSDIMARTIATIMEQEKLLTQPLVVVNRPGASGVLGYTFVGNKAGDPYALSTATSSFIIQPLLGKMKITHREYTLVAGLALDEFLIVVRNDSPFKTMADLLVAARKEPKSVKIGGTSVPSIDSIIASLIEKAAGVQFNFIAFKSGGEVMLNLLGGNIDVASANPGEALTQIEAKKARALGSLSAKRLESFPDVPTLREQGIDVVFSQWRGVVAPRDLPKEAEQVLVAAFQRLSESKAWREKYLKENNLTPLYMPPAEFRKYLDAEWERFGQILREMGVLK